eukprot:jgi/Botrbrau1/23620/Bobra.55_2s0013.1
MEKRIGIGTCVEGAQDGQEQQRGCGKVLQAHRAVFCMFREGFCKTARRLRWGGYWFRLKRAKAFGAQEQVGTSNSLLSSCHKEVKDMCFCGLSVQQR